MVSSINSQKIKIILISGWRGAGKTSLIAPILKKNPGFRVLADDGESDPRELLRSHLRETGDLAKRDIQGFVIEVDSVVESSEVVSHFSEDLVLANPDDPIIEVQACLAVVDATRLMAQLAAPTLLIDLKMQVDEHDDYTDADVIVDQIEFADVIVVTRIQELEADAREKVLSILEWLNTRAIVISSDWPLTPAFSEVLNSTLSKATFELEAATTGAGWMQILAGSHPKADRGVGMNGFSFRARRPFHPSRFKAFLERLGNESVIRAKGLIWFATRNSEAGIWMQAGNGSLISSTGAWWAATPMREWPEDPLAREEIMSDWLPPYGDRRQEFAIIGFDLSEMELRRDLKHCLLTDDEFQAGPEAWSLLDDPLPDWNLLDDPIEDDDSYLN